MANWLAAAHFHAGTRVIEKLTDAAVRSDAKHVYGYLLMIAFVLLLQATLVCVYLYALLFYLGPALYTVLPSGERVYNSAASIGNALRPR